MGNTLSSWGGARFAEHQIRFSRTCMRRRAIDNLHKGILDRACQSAGKKKVQGIITSSGLPLQVDGDGPEEDNKVQIQLCSVACTSLQGEPA